MTFKAMFEKFHVVVIYIKDNAESEMKDIRLAV